MGKDKKGGACNFNSFVNSIITDRVKLSSKETNRKHEVTVSKSEETGGDLALL
jgi:hypothetical protein